ncbi:MAG TPA: hypothetical protein VFO78_13055 [Candidatus Limnocylindrales bacterium]|nr:hypothetical protein [Candidatus Limnocylindrales bacterium]
MATLVAAVILSVACERSSHVADVSTVLLPSEADDFYGVAWLPDGEMVVGRRVGDADDARLAVIDPADGSARNIVLAEDGRCWRERHLSPTALPDGRLGFVHVCMHDADNHPPDETEIRALDVSSGVVERLIAIGPLGITQNVQFTAAPSLREAVVAVGAGICGGLVIYSAAGVPRQFAVEIEGAGRQFSLATPVNLDGHCDDTGTAFSPDFSPDGEMLAFFASPAAVGVSGLDRLKVTSNLYLLELATNEVRSAVNDVFDPGVLRWSPNGRSMAFSGEIAGEGALWLVNRTGDVRRLADPASDIAWSPDGKALFATVPAGDLLLQRLVLIPVPVDPDS